MKKFVKMPSVQNVAVGATCTLDLPLGLTYDFLVLQCGGDLTVDTLENIQVRINGKTVMEFKDGNELNDINEYHGRVSQTSGAIIIWFMRPELTLSSERMVTAIGTSDITTLSFQCGIKSNAGVASPKLTIYAQQSAQTTLGVINKIRAFPRSAATAGDFEISNIPRSGARIAAIHMFNSGISSVVLKADGRDAIDATDVTLSRMQEAQGKDPSDNSFTTIDFVSSGDIQDALITEGLQDLLLRPYLDAAGDIRTVVEFLQGFSGL